MMSEWADKVALVTGAGLGVGRATAVAFAAQGAALAVQDMTPLNLDETASEIRNTGGRCKEYFFDVVKKMPLQAMVNEILDDWGRIDILINNTRTIPHSPILDMDEWDWHRTLDVNLTAPYLLIQVVGRIMRSQNGGVIVNLGSLAGETLRLPERSAYIASQMGLAGLTRQAARELAPYGIRVNMVSLGLFESEPEALYPPGPDWLERQVETIPVKRLGLPGEAAGLVMFLCSQAAAYLTGQVISLNGGLE